MKKTFLVFTFFALINAPCIANTIHLVGGSLNIGIKRSASTWFSDTSNTLSANITTADRFKITIEGILSIPAAWTGRSLRVLVHNHDHWAGVSFQQAMLVDDGTSSGAIDLATNLQQGVHPPARLVYMAHASRDASTGPAHLTVIYTLVPDP